MAARELYTRSQRDSPYEMGRDPHRNPIQRLHTAANLANRGNADTVPQLIKLLQADDAAIRRWGAIRLLALRERTTPGTETLLAALQDPSPDVRMTAAEALCGSGRVEAALPTLIALLSYDSRIIRNETLLTLCRIGEPARAALPHLDTALSPSQHAGLWSYDNIPDAIRLTQACLGGASTSEGSKSPHGTARKPAPEIVPLQTTR